MHLIQGLPMKKLYTIILTLFVSVPFLQAQMWNGSDTLYGNEWINFDQTYFKIMIAEDGMYRISKATLDGVGISLNTIEGKEFQLFYMGEEAPIYVSTSSFFGDNDYIEFYGATIDHTPPFIHQSKLHHIRK